MYLNVAAYQFTDIDSSELPRHRDELLESCLRLELRGTILLSTEGINLFLAGREEHITELRNDLSRRGLGDMEFKESWSDHKPFNRMLVKIKREIIAFGRDDVDPAHEPAKYISPRELERRLDAGEELTLLDTRNEYETRLGTFRGARTLGIDHFRDFPGAVEHGESVANLDRHGTLVTFCTGGIRCEKAAPYLHNQGFENVYQLEGGILKYFEACGSSHYDGECFVYDRRVALNSRLEETPTVQCFNCHHPVTSEDQLSESYVPDQSCPHCIHGKPIKGLME